MKRVIFIYLIIQYSCQHQGAALFYHSTHPPFRGQVATCCNEILHR